MTSLAGWSAALRIARREARRAKGRSVLVVALIGLPVLGAAFAAVSYDMFTLTVEERLVRELGAADAQLNWVGDGPVTQADVDGEGVMTSEPSAATPVATSAHTAADVLALLPPGSRVTPHAQGEVRLDTATGIGGLAWHAIDLTDPITRGFATVTGGRAPAAAGEAAITDAAADRLDASVGDSITLADGGGSYAVVGIVEFPGNPNGPLWLDAAGLNDSVVLFHPGGQPAESWGTRWLVDTPQPVDWEQVQALNRHGVLVYSRTVAHDPPAGLSRAPGSYATFVPSLEAGVIVGGLAALEIVLLAGPAFAVGARRRQRDLALVAAGGGTPAQLRRIVLADGVVLGALAAVVGLTLGVAAGLAARPLVEQLIGARAGGYRVFPQALAAIAVLAVGTGLVAALVPACTAARQQVVDALAGRRGAIRSRRRWLVLGIVLVVFGSAIAGVGAWGVTTTVMIAGLVLGQLGLALCTPTLIGLAARLGFRLPLAPRIALRDTARNRAAAAPAISAVMAAVAGSVTAGMVLLAIDHQRWGDYQSYEYASGTAAVEVWGGEGPLVDPAAVEQAARATLPVAEVHRQSAMTCPADLDLDACGQLVTAIPEAKRCPYWEAWYSSEGLTVAEQHAAAEDPRCDGAHPAFGFSLSVDDGTALPALVEASPAELAEATQVLRDGGAVVTDQRYLADDGTVALGLLDPQTSMVDGYGLVRVPGHLIADGTPRQGAIVGPAVVRAAGQEVQPSHLLFTTTRTPTQAEEDAFIAAIEDLGTFGWLQRDPGSGPANPTLLLLAVAAGVVALGAAGIATGLAAADRRPDLSTLGAIGASPRVRRSLSLSQSGVIAGLGTGLGVLAGIGGAVAVLVGLNQQYDAVWPAPEPYPITVPWPNLLVLLAVPVVAMLGAGLFTRSRLPIERRLS